MLFSRPSSSHPSVCSHEEDRMMRSFSRKPLIVYQPENQLFVGSFLSMGCAPWWYGKALHSSRWLKRWQKSPGEPFRPTHIADACFVLKWFTNCGAPRCFCCCRRLAGARYRGLPCIEKIHISGRRCSRSSPTIIFSSYTSFEKPSVALEPAVFLSFSVHWHQLGQITTVSVGTLVSNASPKACFHKPRPFFSPNIGRHRISVYGLS